MRRYILFLLLLASTALTATGQSLSFKDGIVGSADYNATRTTTEGSNYIDVTYNFEGASLSVVTIDGKSYYDINMNGCDNTTTTGDPALPILIDEVNVMSEKVTLQVMNVEESEFEDINIAPVLAPTLQLATGKPEYKFSDTYTKNAFFPNTNVSLGRVKSAPNAIQAKVKINPINYNPVTKKLKCYQSITYRISWSEEDVPSHMKNQAVEADNEFGKIVSGNKTLHDYFIVTTPDLEESLSDFIEWKTMQGHRCKLISQKWKAEDTASIKASIIVAFAENCGLNVAPKYLLIVGDYSKVPGYLSNQPIASDPARNYTTEFGQISSDLPYVCIDQDDYADMAGGRIPVKDVQTAKNVFKKIIQYEKEPTTEGSFYKHAVHCAQYETNTDNPQYDSRAFILSSEGVRDRMLCFGKTIDRVYTTGDTIGKPTYYSNGSALPKDIAWPSKVWEGKTSDIIDQINDGCFYALHRDHGSPSGWWRPSFTANDIEGLTNKGLYPVVFSINCLTGSHQAPYLNSNWSKCFATEMLNKANAGAAGVIAATGVSYSNENNMLIRQMMHYLFKEPTSRIEPEYEMGKLLNKGLEYLLDYGYHYPPKIFHYFGDPSMQMYTEEPACFNNPIIKQNGTTVTVNTNGVKGCKIALSSYYDQGHTYTNAVEDASMATFKNINFPYVVVISKHNYMPYIEKSEGFDNDKYFQNITFKDSVSYEGLNLYLGEKVKTDETEGPVVVEKSAQVNLFASQQILFKSGFKVTNGGKMHAMKTTKKGIQYKCMFSNYNPESVYDPTLKNPYLNVDPGDTPGIDPSLTGLNDDKDNTGYVFGESQAISVSLPESSDLMVYNVFGQLVLSKQNVTTDKLSIPAGIYIVKYGNNVKKVQVLK